MYWGTSETLLPVYQEVDKACEKHPDVDTVSTLRDPPVVLVVVVVVVVMGGAAAVVDTR